MKPSFLQIRPIIVKGQPNVLHLRAFGDKGPIIFTDKAFFTDKGLTIVTIVIIKFITYLQCACYIVVSHKLENCNAPNPDCSSVTALFDLVNLTFDLLPV